MPRIFKYGDIPNISFTSDKELNILIYRSLSYLIIYRSRTLLKMVRFFGPPCTYCMPNDTQVLSPVFIIQYVITHNNYTLVVTYEQKRDR